MRLTSILRTTLTPDDLARQIVMDSFKTMKTHPELVVESPLPIPMVINSRRRLARANKVHMDHEFHSMYDRAIRVIEHQAVTE